MKKHVSIIYLEVVFQCSKGCVQGCLGKAMGKIGNLSDF